MNTFIPFAADVISGGNIRTIEGHAVLNLEVSAFCSFRDIKKNHFVAAADIDDSVTRKRIRVSLNQGT